MAASPTFAGTAKNARADIATANTNRDGTGTIVDIATAGSAGSRILDITVQATGTTTAGWVRIFLHNGTNYRLLQEIQVSALTPSATVQAFTAYRRHNNLFLPNGWKIAAAPHNAEAFVVHTNYVDY